ncbi:hypothetical protein RFI_11971 [Reticulomyxa filosa]|uniref:Uncharacterized protein n=1 Tax=Reticulomyxa filosa TaxID=46433 RepID=X6NGQ0_RETFI|nr:hypothetical protein RFI_11971 [Reticulomyxa filosa]|eukprot:ETO25171.1 hypothetical protein RFI_11971 [Reticulomyxa filosa]
MEVPLSSLFEEEDLLWKKMTLISIEFSPSGQYLSIQSNRQQLAILDCSILIKQLEETAQRNDTSVFSNEQYADHDNDHSIQIPNFRVYRSQKKLQSKSKDVINTIDSTQIKRCHWCSDELLFYRIDLENSDDFKQVQWFIAYSVEWCHQRRDILMHYIHVEQLVDVIMSFVGFVARKFDNTLVSSNTAAVGSLLSHTFFFQPKKIAGRHFSCTRADAMVLYRLTWSFAFPIFLEFLATLSCSNKKVMLNKATIN